MSGLVLKFTIEAIDKATAPVRRINNMIGRITAPVRKVQASIRSLGIESGLPRIAAAAGVVHDRFSKLTNTLRGLRNGFFYVAAAATAALYPMKRTIDDLSEINDIAASFGISARELQRLTASLTLDGSSIRDAAQSLKFLQQNAVAALTGSEEMETWFHRAGISAEFLSKNLKDPKALLYAFADGLQRIETPAVRVAIANAVLGKSSARVLQTLSRGSQEIKRQGDEAERLGRILDDKTIAAMDAAGDSILTMQQTIGGLTAVITAAALPVIGKITNGVVGWVQANRALIDTRATQFFQELLVRLPAIWDGMKKTGAAIYDIVSAVNSVVQVFGGWGTAIKIVAGIIATNLLVQVAMLVKALLSFNLVLAATPIGWFIAGVAAVAGIAYLLIKNWKFVKTFFLDLINAVFWPLIKVLEIVHGLLPKSISAGTAFGRGLGASLDWVNGRSTSPVFGTGGMASGRPTVASPFAGGGRDSVAQTLDGEIRIKIDSEGKPQLTMLKSNNRGVDFSVDMGRTLSIQ
jgi:hypothetical protein